MNIVQIELDILILSPDPSKLHSSGLGQSPPSFIYESKHVTLYNSAIHSTQ